MFTLDCSIFKDRNTYHKLDNNHFPQWCVLCQCLHNIYVILCLNNKSCWVSIPVWERLQNCQNKPLSSCKKMHFCDKPKQNWYKITTVHLRLSEMWSSEWREEVMQANTKFKQCIMLETKFKKFNGLIYGRCFSLSQCCFLLKAFHFFFEFFTWKDKCERFIKGFHRSGKWLLNAQDLIQNKKHQMRL